MLVANLPRCLIDVPLISIALRTHALQASNILIDRDGVVKLADFGLARTYQATTDGQLTNRVITLWYR